MSDIEQIRPLLEKLSTAINETLGDSISIAEVIEQIKKAGYDIFLVLEITMGIHKREEPEEPMQELREPKPLVQGEDVVPGTFTPKDRRLLRQLKIRLDQ